MWRCISCVALRVLICVFCRVRSDANRMLVRVDSRVWCDARRTLRDRVRGIARHIAFFVFFA